MRVREGKLPRYTERSHRSLGKSLMQKIDFFLIVATRYFGREFLCAERLQLQTESAFSYINDENLTIRVFALLLSHVPVALCMAVIEMQHKVLISSFIFFFIFHIRNLLKFKDYK